MTIRCIGERAEVRIDIPDAGLVARVYVSEGRAGDSAVVSIDQNHLEALEIACRAARMELEARAVSL